MRGVSGGDSEATPFDLNGGWRSVAARALSALALSGLFMMAVSLPAASLPVSADAHIAGNNPTANFGTNSVLSLSQTELGGNKAYLRLDASSFGATNVARVENLRVFWAGSTTQTRTIAFSLITGTGANNWTESGICWTNAPANNVSGTVREFVPYPGQTVTPLGSIQYATGSPREMTLPLGAGSVEGAALATALNSGSREATISVAYNSSHLSEVGIYSREHEGGAFVASAEVLFEAEPVPPMTDAQLFSRLNLDLPGLAAVKAALTTNGVSAAKAALGAYYRQRTGRFHYVDAQNPAASVSNPAGSLQAAQPLVNRTGDYATSLWDGNIFNWEAATMSSKERMYFFSTFGEAAAVETGDQVAQALIYLMRSFAWQYHASNPSGAMWTTMSTGIRMRTGWPTAFQCLLQSPAFTDEDIVLFLKTVWDQTDHIYRNRSDTSNWLTFEMAGLYTSGVVYPEFRDATAWRQSACETAMTDIGRGWLPDGMSIEKSASYGTFFSNYYVMYDLAQFVGRLEEFNFITFPGLTEHLFEAYVKLMAPDRWTPCVNDGGQADVKAVLSTGVTYFPGREDFRWIVSKGAQGAQPRFTSVAFPYAGYLVARSGWETNANYMLFDAGPVGYRHAHQDKLNVVMWSYGRQILLDSPQPGETADWTYLNYLRDTFAHSTGLVDNRPQRRRWYNAPHPSQMPYQPLTDFAWQITEGGAWASGSFSNSYGLAGSVGNDSYPYKVPSNFYDDWGTPATHHRQVAFSAPDLYVVQDWFVPNDSATHTYEIRWQLDSTAIGMNGFRAQTADANQPNLVVIPLRTNGLQVSTASGKLTPEVMGWKLSNGSIRAVTTLRHNRSGAGSHTFVTLLFPLRKGASSSGIKVVEDTRVITVETGDGRVYAVRPAASPSGRLTIDDEAFKDTDMDGMPDWWEIKYFNGPTNAQASAMAANGINTLLGAYVAGLNPADPAAQFKVQGEAKGDEFVLSWDPAIPERNYLVMAGTNVVQMDTVEAIIPGPTNTFTNNVVPPSRFHRIQVQRSP